MIVYFHHHHHITIRRPKTGTVVPIAPHTHCNHLTCYCRSTIAQRWTIYLPLFGDMRTFTCSGNITIISTITFGETGVPWKMPRCIQLFSYPDKEYVRRRINLRLVFRYKYETSDMDGSHYFNVSNTNNINDASFDEATHNNQYVAP